MDTLLLKALQAKLRFTSRNGSISVEDLNDLSLTSLDRMAVAVATELEAQEKTFLATTKKGSPNLQLALDVLKLFITVKTEEAKVKAERADKKAARAFLLDLKAKKEADALQTLSIEDIEKRLAALED